MKKTIILILLIPLFISASKEGSIKIPDEFAFIPMGSMEYNDQTISTDAFIMQKTEVSNKEYKEFIADLKSNNEIEKLKIAQVDSVKWRSAGNYNEPYVKFYHSHPAYDKYPVVNISKEAAQLYCEWLSEKWEKEYGQKVDFRLPTENEWVYAAKAGTNNKFPWEEDSLRDKKGQLKCNFKYIKQENIRKNPKTDNVEITNASLAENIEDYTIMTPVNSYWPNNYGLYCMSGNAAEMTSNGTIKGGSWNSTGYYMQIESESEFSENDIPSPFVGFRVVYTYNPERDK